MIHGEDYYGHYGGQAVADYVAQHIRGSAAEMARIRQTVALVPDEVRTLLDVGAGHGVFLEELKAARGIAGVGVEITEAKVDYARSRGVDMRMGDAGRLDFADGSFDALVTCEVLEHLPFGVYESALREFARVARRWIIVTVPYDERRRFVRCPYCAARVSADYHFRSFDAAALLGLLPGFSLKRTLGLGSQHTSMLREFGRRHLGGWPALLVCPSCGYRQQAAVATGSGELLAGPDAGTASLAAQAHRPGGRLRAALAHLARALPVRERPQWLVGVFRRCEGGLP
jgi:hypothetical protein